MEDVTMSSEDQTDSSISSSISVATVQHQSIKQRFVAWKIKRNEKNKLRKRQDNRKRNKISKDDFYSKSVEFKAWLAEAKNLDMDMLQPLKAKIHFRTFVKKWNGGKLAAPYYRGVSTLWPDVTVSATPSGTISWTADQQTTMSTPSSVNSLLELHSRTDRAASFSTFGKKRGTAASREIRCRSCFEPTSNVRNAPSSDNQTAPATSLPCGHTCPETLPQRTTTVRTMSSSQFDSVKYIKPVRPSVFRAATFTTKGQPEHRFSCTAALRYRRENFPPRRPTIPHSERTDENSYAMPAATGRIQGMPPPTSSCKQPVNPSVGLYDYSNIKNARESNI